MRHPADKLWGWAWRRDRQLAAKAAALWWALTFGLLGALIAGTIAEGMPWWICALMVVCFVLLASEWVGNAHAADDDGER